MSLFPDFALPPVRLRNRTGTGLGIGKRRTPSTIHHGNSLWDIPAAPALARISVAERNPWGEWSNPDADHLRTVVSALEVLPQDYTSSIAYLRRNRPHSISAGLTFWRAPRSRAHLLNTLLCRGRRTVKRVEQELDFDESGISECLQRWQIKFAVAPRRGHLLDAAGTTYAIEVLHRAATGIATLRIDGYTATVAARYDMRAGCWRTGETVQIGPDQINYHVAGSLLGVTPKVLARALPPTLWTDNNVPLIALERVAQAVAPERWRCTPAQARTQHNACGCTYWDDQRRTCALGNAVPPLHTAAYSCEDHTP